MFSSVFSASASRHCSVMRRINRCLCFLCAAEPPDCHCKEHIVITCWKQCFPQGENFSTVSCRTAARSRAKHLTGGSRFVRFCCCCGFLINRHFKTQLFFFFFCRVFKEKTTKYKQTSNWISHTYKFHIRETLIKSKNNPNSNCFLIVCASSNTKPCFILLDRRSVSQQDVLSLSRAASLNFNWPKSQIN